MNARMRQLHRVLSIAFTVMVVANIACLIAQVNAPWVGLLALLPLLPLLATGLYLFVLPYRNKAREAA